VMGKLRPT